MCSQESDVDNEDLNELLSDTRLLKKLKKGKISEEDFDKHMSSAGSSHPKRAEKHSPDGEWAVVSETSCDFSVYICCISSEIFILIVFVLYKEDAFVTNVLLY